ncbi:uncharacterized protein [Rutidosis leptorrhynchoides]|uniref:uncharacterized protein n=1 Tax=Rutidosis leptorrhynchoides TaxID=125765 RepID=UPI003A9A2603
MENGCFLSHQVVEEKTLVTTILKYSPSNQVVLIINVYAPPQESRKKLVWSHLTNIALNWPGPLCFLGDFNSVCSPEERLRESIDHNSIVKFSEFICNASLMDQSLANDEFTWEGPFGKFSRIDRVLCNHCWVSLWTDAILQTVQTDKYDHKPIVFGKKLCNWGPKPFRLNNLWLANKGFMEFCESKWDSFQVIGWAAFKINKKLRMLKSEIKFQNTRVE